MTAADSEAILPIDPRKTGTQLRPDLWDTINQRYPGSMIRKDSYVPQAKLAKPLSQSRLTLISSCGVHLKSDAPLDVCHPFGDFRFLRVPSAAKHEDLIIHQLKYPHDDADLDVNVIFPSERLQAIQAEGIVGTLSANLFSVIGYNMDPDKLERTVAAGIADAVEEERADCALLAPA